MCLFYDPILVKLEGLFAFGLSVCVCVCWGGCFLVGVYDVGLYAEMWLAGSVGHFFKTLNGEC